MRPLWISRAFLILKNMAKELPYYKHEPSEWLEGEIQICTDAAIVCFKNLCAGYWLKLGCISYAFALHKYCRKDASILQELINGGIVDLIEDKICIKFLDKQLKEVAEISKKKSENARKRWEKQNDDADAMQMHSKSNAIRRDKIRKEENNIISKDICQNPAEIDEEIPLLETEEIKFSQVKEKKTTHEKIDFEKLLSFYNEMFDRRCRVIPNAVKQKFNARMRDGYTKDNIIHAMVNAKKEKNHKESGYKWLTLEFFSRHDKLDIYGTIANQMPVKQKNSLPQNQEYRE